MLAVWLAVLMVDALAAPGAALVATPDSGKRTRARERHAPGAHPRARRLALTPHADVCNMKPGAFTFYSPAACYVHAIGRSETSFLLPTRANQRFCFPPFYCSNSLCSCAQRKGCFAFLCPDKVIRSQQTQLLLHRVLSLSPRLG